MTVKLVAATSAGKRFMCQASCCGAAKLMGGRAGHGRCMIQNKEKVAKPDQQSTRA